MAIAARSQLQTVIQVSAAGAAGPSPGVAHPRGPLGVADSSSPTSELSGSGSGLRVKDGGGSAGAVGAKLHSIVSLGMHSDNRPIVYLLSMDSSAPARTHACKPWHVKFIDDLYDFACQFTRLGLRDAGIRERA